MDPQQQNNPQQVSAPPPTIPPQQPQYAPVQPTQPRPRRKLKLALIAVGVFILILMGGGLIAYTSTKSTVKEANGFISAVVNKDLDSAYAYFGPDLKSKQSIESFKASFTNAPFDDSCELSINSRSTSKSTASGSTKTVEGNIVCGDTEYPTKMTFQDADDGQKLSSYSIDPAK